MAWTEEKVSKLKELWGSGLTTSQIGEQLGYSKNAVIGKAHRLGLAQAVPGNTGGSAGAAVSLKPPSKRGSNAKAAGEEWVAIRAREAEQSLRGAGAGATGATGAKGGAKAGQQEVAAFRPRSSAGSSAGVAAGANQSAQGAQAAGAAVAVSTSGRTCQWPIGEAKSPDFHFCGDPATEDSPYCPEHRSRAYVRKTG